MIDPPSPPARRLRGPSWLRPRPVAGLLLIVLSMAAGARVVSAADRSVLVWAAAGDLSAGTVLVSDDLRPARVRLYESGARYLDTALSPAGYSLTRQLAAGELVPAAALRTVAPGLVVNIPVPPANAPAVNRGQSVDVWASTRECLPQRVLAAVTVQDVRSDGEGGLPAGAGALQVMVRVGGAEAERVVAALSREATIRLVVLDGDPPGPAATGPVCGRPGGPADGGG